MKWILNIISNYLKFLINMVIVFFLTPFIIDALGVESFGLWSLIFGVVGVFGLLDFGFATAAVKYVAEARGAKDVDKLNTTMSSLLLIYCALGLLCFVLVWFGAVSFSQMFKLSDSDRTVFVQLVQILGSVVAFSLPLSLFKAVLLGCGRMIYVNVVELVLGLANAVAIVSLLSHGWGIEGLALSNACMMMGNLLALIPIAYKVCPELRFQLQLFDRSRVRQLLSFSVYAFVANIAMLIILRIDPLVIGMFLPVSAIAVYAIAGKISEYTYLLNKQFSNALMPLISQANGAGDSLIVELVLLKGTRYLLAIALPFVGLLWYHSPAIVDIWVGEEFVESVLLLQILLVAMGIGALQLNAANVLGMTGHHRFVAIAMACSAALNLLLSLILIQWLGLLGVAIATLVATVLVEMCGLLPQACKVLNLSFVRFLREGVVPSLPALVPTGVVAFVLNALWPAHDLFSILWQGATAALTYFMVFMLTGLASDDRIAIRKRLKRRSVAV